MPFFGFIYSFFCGERTREEIESERSMDEEIELDQDMDGLSRFMTPEMDRR